MEIIEKNKDISIFDIENIENKFNITFPNDYKKFLLKYNGGKPKYNFSYFNENLNLGPLKIMEFYSLEKIVIILEEIDKDRNSDEDEDLLTYYIFIRDNMLIIADTYNQVQICICYKGENIGKIYYSDHIHDDEFTFLFNSFDDFMNSFKIDPEDSND